MQIISQQDTETPNIRRILQYNLLEAYFQPVISMTRQTVCGMEGLIRCTQTMIPPRALFDAAEEEGLTLELDRQCRDAILKAFSAVCARHPDKMLFLNVDASILDTVGGSGYLLSQVEKYHIPPGRIVLEINETRVRNAMGLGAFIRLNREAGFLLALDDVGTGFSNLDRIPIVKPDIIKIDISLVRHIEKDYHRQEVFRSLVRLASRIGAMTVAEGVESEEEALTVMRLGAGMIQGFYFSRPHRMDESLFENSRIDELAGRYKRFISHCIADEQQQYASAARAVDAAVEAMACCGEFDDMLGRVVERCNLAECAYVLDASGLQCSATVFQPGQEGRQNGLYYSAQPGDDHSMKTYYYGLPRNKSGRYMTEPYVSLATGSLCVTLSRTFWDAGGFMRILCIDFKAMPKL
jgi:EAL domain-containing protein (putative c-di-GMP-specific phosphodiesterase class I)